MSWFVFIAALYTLNPLTISVYPPVSMAPATIRITVMVPRHVANRWLCFGVDGPELKRSCLELDGEASRKVWTVYWAFRSVGTYEASAVLTRLVDGRVTHVADRQPFQVIGPEF